MTRTELAAEAWKAWVKDQPLQSEDTEKGFREGFNFCLLGKIKVEGGDKGELISANFLLRDRLQQAKDIIRRLMHELVVSNIPYEDVELLVKDTEQFLKEEEGGGDRRMKAKAKNKAKPQCSDQCEHCIYIEEGDFMCDVVQDVSIVNWKPFLCACPKKRRLIKC